MKKFLFFLSKITLLIAVIALFWEIGVDLDAWLIKRGEKELQLQEKVGKALKRTVYILDKEQWTEFSLLPKYQLVKVLSNATVSHALSVNRELEWRYALQYQVLDKEGNLLAERDYHHRTKATVYQDGETGEILRAKFYITPNQQPTDGRYMFINLSEIPNASLLRFRFHSADSDVMDLGIRVSWRETTNPGKLDYLWHRLSDLKKQVLVRGNVYEPEFLNKQERYNLLRERWTPMGPLGVAGEDYYPRVIYIHREFEGDIIPPPIQSYGVFVDPLHWATVPLLEQGGLVRFRFSNALPLPGQNPTKLPVTITIKWYGRKKNERVEHSIVWDGSDDYFDQEFVGGLLEIIASQPVMVRVFIEYAGAQREITPPPTQLSTIFIQQDMPVGYQFNHYSELPIPVRIDIRQLLGMEVRLAPGEKENMGMAINQAPTPFPIILGNMTDCQVSYTLLDVENTVQKTGTIAFTQSRSFYDRTMGKWWGPFEISDPDTFYFHIPPQIKTLRLSSPCAALVTVYNRPIGMLVKKRIPEDYYHTPDNLAPDQQVARLPAWFKLRPENYIDLYEINRAPLLRTQRRPPETDKLEEMLAGNYLWEDFLPENKYQARYLLTMRDSELPIRDQALGAIYQKIPKERPVTLEFVNAKKTVQPTLIYLRPKKKPVYIHIMLNGLLYYKGYIIGKRGQLKLPNITTGVHTFMIKTQGQGDFFINHARTTEGNPAFVKRLVHRFDQRMQFINEKRSHDKELVSVRLYMPYGMEERLQIRVKLSAVPKTGLQNYIGWTFFLRDYDIRPAGGDASAVLNTPNDFVDSGQFFVIPLQEDLPPGHYAIELEPEKKVGAYITLSKITVGLQEEVRQFFSDVSSYDIIP